MQMGRFRVATIFRQVVVILNDSIFISKPSSMRVKCQWIENLFAWQFKLFAFATFFCVHFVFDSNRSFVVQTMAMPYTISKRKQRKVTNKTLNRLKSNLRMCMANVLCYNEAALIIADCSSVLISSKIICEYRFIEIRRFL